MKRPGMAVWLMLLVAIVSAGAGLVPLLRGRPMNGTFVALGAFWLIIAIATGANARKRTSGSD